MSPVLKFPGGLVTPIPAWTVQVFGVLALLGLSVAGYRYVFPREPALVTAQQANHVLVLEVQEYNKHILEAPLVQVDDPHRTIHLRAFEDGCLLVSRRLNGQTTTRLLLDPTRPDLTHTSRESRRVTSLTPPSLASLLPGFDTVVSAAERPARCLTPHPGVFQWWYGAKRDACWLEVWRVWPDGCQHVQLFNVCANSWATHPDGSPQVLWTRCVH